QGNITIAPGGLLIVQNVTLSMVQFVGSSGTLVQRLSNISRILDEGTMRLINSTLTTDTAIANAYIKLNVTVTGALALTQSALEFPGWLSVSGKSAVLFLNESTVTRNPNAASAEGGKTVVGDVSYAANLNLSDGASLQSFGSVLSDPYANNLSSKGEPGPLPFVDSQSLAISPSSWGTLDNFLTPTNVSALTQDWLNPLPYRSGTISLNYSVSSGFVATNLSAIYAGRSFNLGVVNLYATSGETFAIPLSAGLLAWINDNGPLAYLRSTGSFDHNAPTIAIQFNATGIGDGSGTIHNTTLVMAPSLSFNYVLSNSSALLADSTMDLTWSDLPSTPASSSQPYAWGSNKLALYDGSSALLANLSVPSPLPSNWTSAIQADSSSRATLFRWAEFSVGGPAGQIGGARVSAFPLGSAEMNRTATALNNLSSTSPALWAYVLSWTQTRGLPGYGLTGSSGSLAGLAFLLLASSNLTNTSSSGPTFLGNYHIGVSAPFAGATTNWSNWNVSPYPENLVHPTPDVGPTAFFAGYTALLTISSWQVSIDGSVASSIRIGETAQLEARVESAGITNVTNLSGTVTFRSDEETIYTSEIPLTAVNISPGHTYSILTNWSVNESTIGVHGTLVGTIEATIAWNGGSAEPTGGSANSSTPLTVAPSTIAIDRLTAPSSPLDPATIYVSQGTVSFNGSGEAEVNLTAVPEGGGAAILLSSNLSYNGSFELTFGPLAGVLLVGVAYTLEASAQYNSENSTAYVLPGTFQLSVSGSAGGGFVIPWWVWVAVGLAALGGALFVMARRRRDSARVECGECATLVPASATTCPVCGIFFEPAETRCLQCGGPVPVGVEKCPGCNHVPADRPTLPGPEGERDAFHEHLAVYRAAAQGDLGEDYPEIEFWKWWRRQPAYQSFRDWKEGRAPRPTPRDGDDGGTLDLGDGT
ncbi:MAG: zinc ribbon domain-containing protein, partial [Acidimicrobiales bacterium]